jgi:ABC-type uncharacterized transport system substrate-binding protein
MVDPVGDGFVASLARPGGNITGLTLTTPEMTAKRLQLLKETIPPLSGVAYLADKNAGGYKQTRLAVESAARLLGLQLQVQEVGGPGDLTTALPTLSGRARARLLFPQARCCTPTEFKLLHSHRRIVCRRYVRSANTPRRAV